MRRAEPNFSFFSFLFLPHGTVFDRVPADAMGAGVCAFSFPLPCQLGCFFGVVHAMAEPPPKRQRTDEDEDEDAQYCREHHPYLSTAFHNAALLAMLVRGPQNPWHTTAVLYSELPLPRQPVSCIRATLHDARPDRDRLPGLARLLGLLAGRPCAVSLCAGMLQDVVPLVAAWVPTRGTVAVVGLPLPPLLSKHSPSDEIFVLAAGETWEAGPDTGDPLWTPLMPFDEIVMCFEPPPDPAAGVEWTLAVRFVAPALTICYPENNVLRTSVAPRRRGEPAVFIAYFYGMGYRFDQEPSDARRFKPRPHRYVEEACSALRSLVEKGPTNNANEDA